MGLASQSLQLLKYRRPPDTDRPRCPWCMSYDVRPSMRRNFIDAVLDLIALGPYRCRSCHRHFHKSY